MTDATDVRTAVTWHDGALVEITETEWNEIVPQFLGCGYRLLISPRAGMAGLDFDRLQIDRMAEIFGTAVDESPWRHLRANRHPEAVVELIGGWPYGQDRQLKANWNRIRVVHAHRDPLSEARAGVLPWWYSSDSPVSGLPTVSGLEKNRAAEHLVTNGLEVGLWANNRGELCTTTAGPCLVLAGGCWTFPSPEAGFVSNWHFFRACNSLGATPETIAVADSVATADALVAVDMVGNITGVSAVGDRLLRSSYRIDEVVAALS